MTDDAFRHLTMALRLTDGNIQLYPIVPSFSFRPLYEVLEELQDGYKDNTNSRPDIIYPNKKIFLEEFSLNLQSGFMNDGKITTSLMPDREARKHLPVIHESRITSVASKEIIQQLTIQFDRILDQHKLDEYKLIYPGYRSVLLVSDFTPAYHYPPNPDGLNHLFMPDVYFHKAVQKAGWDYLFWYYCDVPSRIVKSKYQNLLHVYERSFWGLNQPV